MTFVHIRNICYWSNFKGTRFKRCQQTWCICPGNMYALATFLHITNISAVTGPILTFWTPILGGHKFLNVLGPNFIRHTFFSGPNLFRDQNFFWTPKFFQTIISNQNIFLDQTFFWPQIFFRTPNFFQEFFLSQKKILNSKYFGPQNFLNFFFQTKNYFLTQI